MSIIQNKEELSTNSLRKAGLDILEAGLLAVQTTKIIESKIKIKEGHIFCINESCLDLTMYKRVFFIGIGKCAFDGASVIESVLGDFLTQGIVIDVKGGVLKKMKSMVGTHPYPSEINIKAAEEIVKMLKDLTEQDLVLALISGGGSSLFCLPNDRDCENLINITKDLTFKGADILELNTVRKHLSQVQGGGLAKLCFPASVISLIFSDVLGNDLEFIASGPTVMDQTSISDAQKVLEKFGLAQKYESLEFTETPKDEKYFKHVYNTLLCTNMDALMAMKEKAVSLGFDTLIMDDSLSGEAKEVGKKLAQKEHTANSCLLFGGESTVKVGANSGVGGRNQEVALAALPLVCENSLIIAASSDGYDNTPSAGAIADREILEKSKSLELDPEDFLARNDSFNFFRSVGGAISTGRLGSNVSDLFIILNK